MPARRLRTLLIGALALVLIGSAQPALAAVTSSSTVGTTSLSGSSFDPAYIISDALFYQRDAMSEAEIQTFLNQKIGTCSNTLCLNILLTATNLRTNDRDICLGYQPDVDAFGNPVLERPSRILYKVQQSCGISARVLLTTLQKEQGLVTSKSPTEFSLSRAMGYGCPDSNTGTCDAKYYGFFNQVYSAAWQYHRYSFPTPWGNYQPGSAVSILYHPKTSCGSLRVTIKNNGTAALYNYTPYVPNEAALANLYGTGDGCSSYGNRNFWTIFNNWFGPSTPDAEASPSPSPSPSPTKSTKPKRK
jgi:hypothetical protein